MAHLRIFLNILALIIGTWSAITLRQMWKSYGYDFLSPFIGFMITLNIIIFNDLLDWYLMTNLYQDPASFDQSFYKIIAFPIYYSLFLFYSYFQIRIIATFNRWHWKNWMRRFLGIAFFVSISMILFSQSIPDTMLAKWFHWIVTGSLYAIVFFRLILLILTFWNAKKEQNDRYRQMLILFASFYLVVFIPSFIRNLHLAAAVDVFVLVIAMLHVILASFPMIWLQYTFLLYHRSLILDTHTQTILDRKWKQFGISNREREIAALVLQGLKNQEIENRLIISPHTVKNHIYNLYKKAGVNSRAQFVRLMMEP